MTEKMDPRDANHPSKNGQDSFLIICSYQSSLPFLSVGGGATLGFIFYIQSHFYFNFENVSAHIVTIILNIPELSKLLHFA